MSLSPPPATAVPQLNTARKSFNVSVATVLFLLSFLSNQGSKQGVETLVGYIYTTLGLDLDYIIPSAAVPEDSREIDGLNLTHRIMLVNLLRLLGVIKTKKASCQIVTRATQGVLPLSPNHRLFGNDGLHCVSSACRGAHPSFCASCTIWESGSGSYACV